MTCCFLRWFHCCFFIQKMNQTTVIMLWPSSKRKRLTVCTNQTLPSNCSDRTQDIVNWDLFHPRRCIIIEISRIKSHIIRGELLWTHLKSSFLAVRVPCYPISVENDYPSLYQSLSLHVATNVLLLYPFEHFPDPPENVEWIPRCEFYLQFPQAQGIVERFSISGATI